MRMALRSKSPSLEALSQQPAICSRGVGGRGRHRIGCEGGDTPIYPAWRRCAALTPPPRNLASADGNLWRLGAAGASDQPPAAGSGQSLANLASKP